jgi:hypothetical protein
MTGVKCEDVENKWQAYLNGTCSEEGEHLIDEHLNNCERCQHRLEMEMDEQESQTKKEKNLIEHKNRVNELPIKKQKQLLRRAKWKNRLTTAFTIFFLFIFISLISGLLTGLYYVLGGEDGKANQAMQVVKTATEMTMPNVYLFDSTINTNAYFTAEMEMSIKKQIGGKIKRIGHLEGNMLLNQLTVKRDWYDGQYEVNLSFIHPYFASNQLEEQIDLERILRETWDTLEILPDGTVAELATSFDEQYDIQEVNDLLSDYDLDIVWYAIDTGTEKYGTRYGSPYLTASNDLFGIHDYAVFDFIEGGLTDSGRDGKREEAFKKGLKLLAENEKMTKRYMPFISKDTSLIERYRYVEEHGVKSYGVVVTGPTKELLKLQENETIIYATMGDVDFYNWYSTPTSGTIYD